MGTRSTSRNDRALSPYQPQDPPLQKSRGLRGEVQGFLKIADGDPAWFGREQINGLEPQMEFDVARPEDRIDGDSEGSAEGIALVELS